MKFYINKLILWTKNGNIRTLEFKPNKVNVITGASNTGKTVIWSIIDYCLFSSKPKIPEEVINENISWYGIQFSINNKLYTIARASLTSHGTPSKDYYFSGTGDIPTVPIPNNKEDDIREIIEPEFSIDENVKIPYGGKYIEKGSKISFRYFLLFNTQDENTITHTDTLFDKQTNSRYKEALNRIFDLAIGISDVKETLINEKVIEIEKEIRRLKRKKAAYEKENELFEKEMSQIIKRSQEYGLIDDSSTDITENIKKLKMLVIFDNYNFVSAKLNQLEKLEKTRLELIRKIKTLKKFEYEYEQYKKILSNSYDSLKPINYIEDNFSEIIETKELKEFIYNLRNEFLLIKDAINKKSPVQTDIKKKIRELNKELSKIEKEIDKYPTTSKEFANEVEKYILFGEIKTRLEIYEKKWEEEDFVTEIFEKEEELNNLLEQLGDKEEKRNAVIRLLEELIQVYLNQLGDALENYKNYKAAFIYKEKVLRLRKEGSAKITKVIGSSSNQLFLHLCFFLGLHELIIRQEVPFIPPFLFLDQPSRPYYDNDEERATDREKITVVFKLLNDFITRMNTELGSEFQFIVLEHIPKEIWQENNMLNVHLVEEFRHGNKLIRKQDRLN
ncbi:DUF3732 domain-containing protein [Aneurinibacillus thermoaerophilus]|uniref:DUF3732 domain-containing protein n=1 Tax=Aneurinibacillus thermoaerophilus TaxID=143495 RepID=A0ABX8Y7V9_ANETH|nr:DUF3732 domain-containing protein [Aneurinibacillus thermoaerophilus]QYY41510.1 DUF3732 domain-containing protein [Aneurinibacillus thermoaerophilus]